MYTLCLLAGKRGLPNGSGCLLDLGNSLRFKQGLLIAEVVLSSEDQRKMSLQHHQYGQLPSSFHPVSHTCRCLPLSTTSIPTHPHLHKDPLSTPLGNKDALAEMGRQS